MPHVTPLLADDPRRVGRYRLTGRIAGMHADGPAHPGSVPEGTAGMPADGPVYLGRSPEGGEVAVRLFKVDSIGDGAERDRFAAEAKAACRVAPFCAAQILGAGFEGGHAFLVSEYVAGPSLEEFVAEEGPWEGRDLLALAIGTATGLAAIHQAGLVHGDFGPEHVVLGPEGPRVVGFGITPPYGIATPAADLRAWVHTVLYAAAGGTADPEDPEDLALLPEPLRTLAVRCMSADPGDQPSARSLVLTLLGDDHPPAGVLGEGSRQAARVLVRPAAQAADPDPLPVRKRRSAAAWWVAGVAVCLAAIVAVILFVPSQRGEAARVRRAGGRLIGPQPVRAAADTGGQGSRRPGRDLVRPGQPDQPDRRVPGPGVPGARRQTGNCPLFGCLVLLRGQPRPGVRLRREPEAGPGHRPGPVRGGRGHREPGPGKHPAVQL